LSAHATGVGLLRHVGSDDQLRDRPARVWFRRSAVRSVDACVATLAFAIAKEMGVATTSCADYVDAHGSRTIAPVSAFSGRTATRRIRWSAVPAGARALMELRHYYRDGLASRQTCEIRKTRTMHALDLMFRLVDADMPTTYRDLILDATASGLREHSRPMNRSSQR
jgi:hypothetical protein